MKLIKGECLKEMQNMQDNSVDLIICDLPYGMLETEWDVVIDPNSLFNEYKNILTPNGTILLFGKDPFSTTLRIAGADIFRYDLIWKKSKSTGFTHANARPLKIFENISIFSKGKASNNKNQENAMTYNPQGLIKVDEVRNQNQRSGDGTVGKRPSQTGQYIQEYSNYPIDILEFKHDTNRVHPTQKPVALYEYLIRTYSNPGDVILDNCAGSGTLGAAGLNIPDREYIMIELEPKYQEVIIDRIPGIEVIDGDQEVYKVVNAEDEIIALAKTDIGGIEFTQKIKEEYGVEILNKYMKKYKSKTGARLKMAMAKTSS